MLRRLFWRNDGWPNADSAANATDDDADDADDDVFADGPNDGWRRRLPHDGW